MMSFINKYSKKKCKTKFRLYKMNKSHNNMICNLCVINAKRCILPKHVSTVFCQTSYLTLIYVIVRNAYRNGEYANVYAFYAKKF